MIQLIEDLPEEATAEDAFEKLYIFHKVVRGLNQADAGQKISQEEARRQIKRWLG